jgi:hypothetical protein
MPTRWATAEPSGCSTRPASCRRLPTTETNLESDHASGDGRFQLPHMRLSPSNPLKQLSFPLNRLSFPLNRLSFPLNPAPNCVRGFSNSTSWDGLIVPYASKSLLVACCSQEALHIRPVFHFGASSSTVLTPSSTVLWPGLFRPDSLVQGTVVAKYPSHQRTFLGAVGDQEGL